MHCMIPPSDRASARRERGPCVPAAPTAPRWPLARPLCHRRGTELGDCPAAHCARRQSVAVTLGCNSLRRLAKALISCACYLLSPPCTDLLPSRCWKGLSSSLARLQPKVLGKLLVREICGAPQDFAQPPTPSVPQPSGTRKPSVAGIGAGKLCRASGLCLTQVKQPPGFVIITKHIKIIFHL